MENIDVITNSQGSQVEKRKIDFLRREVHRADMREQKKDDRNNQGIIRSRESYIDEQIANYNTNMSKCEELSKKIPVDRQDDYRKRIAAIRQELGDLDVLRAKAIEHLLPLKLPIGRERRENAQIDIREAVSRATTLLQELEIHVKDEEIRQLRQEKDEEIRQLRQEKDKEIRQLRQEKDKALSYNIVLKSKIAKFKVKSEEITKNGLKYLDMAKKWRKERDKAQETARGLQREIDGARKTAELNKVVETLNRELIEDLKYTNENFLGINQGLKQKRDKALETTHTLQEKISTGVNEANVPVLETIENLETGVKHLKETLRKYQDITKQYEKGPAE